jgi:hypothetical protein
VNPDVNLVARKSSLDALVFDAAKTPARASMR